MPTSLVAGKPHSGGICEKWRDLSTLSADRTGVRAVRTCSAVKRDACLAPFFHMCQVGIPQHTESLSPDRSQDALHAMVRSSGVIIRFDDIITPDMSEVTRIAWAATQTTRWPPPTDKRVDHGYVRSYGTGTPSCPHHGAFPLLHHCAHCVASSQSGHSSKRKQLIPTKRAGFFLQALHAARNTRRDLNVWRTPWKTCKAAAADRNSIYCLKKPMKSSEISRPC